VCCVLCCELGRCVTDVLVWPPAQCRCVDVKLVKCREILWRVSENQNIMGMFRVRVRVRLRVRDIVSVSVTDRIKSRILLVRHPHPQSAHPHYTCGLPV